MSSEKIAIKTNCLTNKKQSEEEPMYLFTSIVSKDEEIYFAFLH